MIGLYIIIGLVAFLALTYLVGTFMAKGFLAELENYFKKQKDDLTKD